MKKRNILIIFSFCLVFIFLIGLTSAAIWDNSAKPLDTYGKAGYKAIEIVNGFGIPFLDRVLWKGTLDYNSNSCGSNCEAIQTIELTERGSLIDDIKFETILDNGDKIEQDIRSYKISYRLKGSNNWINYNLGTELETGIYEVKLE